MNMSVATWLAKLWTTQLTLIFLSLGYIKSLLYCLSVVPACVNPGSVCCFNAPRRTFQYKTFPGDAKQSSLLMSCQQPSLHMTKGLYSQFNQAIILFGGEQPTSYWSFNVYSRNVFASLLASVALLDIYLPFWDPREWWEIWLCSHLTRACKDVLDAFTQHTEVDSIGFGYLGSRNDSINRMTQQLS